MQRYSAIGRTNEATSSLIRAAVFVRLCDSAFPVSSGSDGQWGGNSSTSGVAPADVLFAEGMVRAGDRAFPLSQLAGADGLVAEDFIELGDLATKYQQSAFVAHFVEVGVDAATGKIRVRRMLALCAAGRILNPKTARSQVIGAMTMGVGAALMEELAVDKRRGFLSTTTWQVAKCPSVAT